MKEKKCNINNCIEGIKQYFYKKVRNNGKFYLIEVKCHNGNTYKTTKDKFIPTNKVPKFKTNRSTYKNLGFCEGGIYGI